MEVLIIIIVWLFYVLLIVGLCIAGYILQSLGLYSAAKRRCIRHPWLAWLPVGNMWIMGSISDQYQYVVKGKVRNFRKVLLGLSAAINLITIPIYVFYFAMLNALFAADGVYYSIGATAAAGALVVMVLSLVMLVLSIIAYVFMCISLYDYFRSCDPSNAVVFLVLGMVISVIMPVFLFVVRNRELGMPPRKPIEQQLPPQE